MDELRSEIERVTQELLALFDERQELSRAIGDYKKTNGLSFHDPAREKELLERYAAGDTRKERLLRLLFELSREVQEE